MYKFETARYIALRDVDIKDPFWSKYSELVRDVVIPYQWEALNDNVKDAEPSYALRNFRIAAGLESGEFNGMVFQDSDVAKWIEAASYYLEAHPDSEMEARIDEVIDIIGKAQQPDGYLNTYYTLKEPGMRWTNLQEGHELYCTGHLIEAAVAYTNATGKTRLLEIIQRYVEHIDNVFGPEPGKLHGYCGHQEIELSLLKLYRLTGNHKYLDLGKYFLDERGKEPYYFNIEYEKRGGTEIFEVIRKQGAKYLQAHLPVRSQDSAEGHAVRMLYMCCAMADVAAETGDEQLFQACLKIWNNIEHKRMYVTGGIGSTYVGESFTFDYDLPNDTVYAETCASIGLFLFGSRMLQIENKARYADVMERALYNTILGGISMDGKRFFYVNPLEVWPEACEKDANKRHVKVTRQKWFGCACCPPNVTRMLTSLGSYIYSVKGDTIFTNLYIGGKSQFEINSEKVGLIQETEYPWNGKVKIGILSEKENKFTLALRIPGWCNNSSIKINGVPAGAADRVIDGYAYITRTWVEGDHIELEMSMPVLRVKANPLVRENIGKVALQRGPIVYCLEEADNGANLHDIFLPEKAVLEAEYEKELLGGMTVIEAGAEQLDASSWGAELYRAESHLQSIPRKIKFIPYFAWANRQPGEMAVWIHEK